MIRHVLLDADGVVQQLPGGWLAALTPYLGDRAELFLREVGQAERPCLRGDGDFRAVLAEHLERYDVNAPVDVVYPAVWHAIEVSPDAVRLVHDLRALGLAVHLATNQEAGRAAYMRGGLGHDELFDQSFYSCELGLAKPEAGFFAGVVERLGTTPPAVLFVDDSQRNVAAAREVGLAAEHWHLDDGIDRLCALLAGHGVHAG